MKSVTEGKIIAEVLAVKNLDAVKLISRLLERRYSKIDGICNVGLNLALRISDFLPIKFDNIHHDRLIIKKIETGKLVNIQFNEKMGHPNLLIISIFNKPVKS